MIFVFLFLPLTNTGLNGMEITFSHDQGSFLSRVSDTGPHLGAAEETPSETCPAQIVKNLPAMQKTQVQSLGWEDPLEKGMATHSSILAWRSLMGYSS